MISLCFLVVWWLLIFIPTYSNHGMLKMIQYAVLVVLLLYFGIVTIKGYYATWYPCCAVRQEAMLRVGPGETYMSCGALQEGATVRVTRCDRAWYRVVGDGGEGWVKGSCLGYE
jgi:hypothetical protein